MVKAIYLDRDGTLNVDTKYPHKIEDFKLLPGVIGGLKKLSKDFIFIIITNQSGIGRSIYTEKQMHEFNQHLIEELKKENIEIKKIYHCPHTPKEICECRKPSTKYIEKAAKEFDIDIKNSWAIGDHPHDVGMGIIAGTRSIYLETGHGKRHSEDLKKNNINTDFVANNFMEAANYILKISNK